MKIAQTRRKQPTILITIDVEDWFQVENFKPWIPFSTWGDRELRVEKNVHKLLDLFDSAGKKQMSDVGCQKSAKMEQMSDVRGRMSERKDRMSDVRGRMSETPINQSTNQPNIRATFFVLGWIAKRLPGMVREIHARGHEVGSHGLDHELPSKMSEQNLLDDLAGSRKMLEDTIGAPVLGYRAPSFAVDDHILELIQEAGYRYDSSYNSFSFHGRYGRLSLNGNRSAQGIVQIGDGFYEIPISNLLLFQKVLPWGGGGYFRLMPSFFFKAGVKAILKDRQSFVFYMHPWEIDPHQPRVNQASFPLKFRHYNNLKWTETKLVDLLEEFSACRFTTCAGHISPQRHGSTYSEA